MLQWLRYSIRHALQCCSDQFVCPWNSFSTGVWTRYSFKLQRRHQLTLISFARQPRKTLITSYFSFNQPRCLAKEGLVNLSGATGIEFDSLLRAPVCYPILYGSRYGSCLCFGQDQATTNNGGVFVLLPTESSQFWYPHASLPIFCAMLHSLCYWWRHPKGVISLKSPHCISCLFFCWCYFPRCCSWGFFPVLNYSEWTDHRCWFWCLSFSHSSCVSYDIWKKCSRMSIKASI